MLSMKKNTPLMTEFSMIRGIRGVNEKGEGREQPVIQFGFLTGMVMK